MSGLLALVALERLIVPELQRLKGSIVWIIAACGALAYLYAALESRGI
jgi:hypothetical protein